MTTKQIQDERLAVAVNDISTMKDDIKEIKANQKSSADKQEKFEEKIDLLIQNMDKTFVTRAELKITQWSVGFVISAITIFFLIKDKIQ
jgi:hypothetical protein